MQVGAAGAVGQVEYPASNHLHGVAQVEEVSIFPQPAKSGYAAVRTG